MKTYRVRALVTISLSTLVEAESEAEAMRIAESRALPRITEADDDDDGWHTSGELDGTPDVSGVEEA